MTRNANTSVALPPEPVDTRLPFMSAILRDAGAVDRHHVHAVRVQHRERAHRNRLAGELVLALERIDAPHRPA